MFGSVTWFLDSGWRIALFLAGACEEADDEYKEHRFGWFHVLK